MSVFIYSCVSVCLCVCVSVCLCVSVSVCPCLCLCLCLCVCVWRSLCLCLFLLSGASLVVVCAFFYRSIPVSASPAVASDYVSYSISGALSLYAQHD